ncbi:AI-2E family transporter [Trinickia sp. LjRoot230]|uniref:AI-2E family transporter n=1 Tax=Trinickia sp. LjRoot230 TaxID=3342288 RepID=UPI003ECDC407
MSKSMEPPPTRPATPVEPPEARGVQGLVTLAVGLAVVASLYFAREILIPVTFAVLLSFLVSPLVNFLIRIRLGRIASVLVAALISLSVIILLGGVIATQLTNLALGIPQYQAAIETKIDAARAVTFGKLNDLVGAAGDALQQVTIGHRQPIREPASASSASQSTAALPVEVREPVPTAFQLMRRVLAPVVRPLETTFIVFIVTIVILLQRDDLRDRAIRLFGSRDLHRTTTAMDEAARRLSRYFLSQLGVNAGVGVVIGAGLFFIGVPNPMLWGILAALLRLVPYVGIWISALLATVLAAAVSPGWSMAIWSLALFFTVELLVGQAVEPLLYGHSTGLSPFSVVIAAIFWSWIWGPVGLILSTPLTLCVLVLGRHIARLEFLDVLLGDQPALTPIENFYQRALAGDPDEALEQAEILLRDRSLCTYYDQVAVKGLQLAANDVTRGRVTAAQLARIQNAANDLIEGLDGFEDTDPAPAAAKDNWSALAPSGAERDVPPPLIPPIPPTNAQASIAQRADNQVLCIAGRGPLDESASTILAQLLGKHHCECRVIPNDAVSRARIDSLDITAVTIVCIFYLNIDGIPSHLRYLLRRLRQRLPDASIVVGLWPTGGTDQWSKDLQSAIGADHYVTSVREMVDVCLASTRSVGAIGPQPRDEGAAV